MRVFLLISFLGVVGLVYASSPWVGKTLSAKEVKKRWGEAAFDQERFKSGDVASRATMAYSLITSKKFLGLTAEEVRNELGRFDGHYFSESYPTYFIQKAKVKGEDSQLPLGHFAACLLFDDHGV